MVDRSRLWGPGGVLIAHVVIVSICVWYDPENISPSSLRGWISLFLIACTITSLFRCSLVDPGIVHRKNRDAETPPESDRKLVTLPIKSRQRLVELETHTIAGTTITIPDDEPISSQETLRWCAICDLHQPLRTKHCEELNKCIRTFDHYCPWISNCVGEFNRAWFFIYLIFESLVLLWFGGFGVAKIHVHAGQADKLGSLTALILAIALIAIFLLMTGLLVSYHAFLAATNLTTWEHSSWRKISYLKNLNPVNGSPFSAESVWINFRIYFRAGRWVEFDDDGGIIWRLGPQHSLFPEACQFFCDN